MTDTQQQELNAWWDAAVAPVLAEGPVPPEFSEAPVTEDELVTISIQAQVQQHDQPSLYGYRAALRSRILPIVLERDGASDLILKAADALAVDGKPTPEFLAAVTCRREAPAKLAALVSRHRWCDALFDQLAIRIHGS